MNMDELDRRFSFHPPTVDKTKIYDDLRREAKAFAGLILIHCPDSRERSLALTALEETLMWANASVSRRS